MSRKKETDNKGDKTMKELDFDKVQACFWFLADNHQGQWSEEYEALSFLSCPLSDSIAS